MKLALFTACLIAAATAYTTVTLPIEAAGPIKVTLFYESYCPDCINYIGDELLDVWQDFKDNIQLDLIPFGNAEQFVDHGKLSFKCQHGPKECLANKLHACAIYQACGRGGTRRCPAANVTRALDYIHCVEEQPDQEVATRKCAAPSHLSSEGLVKCAHNQYGDRMLSFYGNFTKAFRPKITYVPTVAINGKHSEDAEKSLRSVICKMEPTLCTANIDTNTV